MTLRPTLNRSHLAQPMEADAARDILNALTIDVEDYYHVSAFETHVPRSRWGDYESRVLRNTHRILDLLDQHDVKATFFVLGWVAERHPHLVREIDNRGHEIGSHSYWHRLIYRQSPEDFRADLRRSRDVIQDQVGRSVVVYRAPSFSITKDSLWALEVLVEEGFRLDSSVFPVRHDRYGIPNAPRTLHRIRTAAGDLWELPPCVMRAAGINIPVGGGGYLRLYPFRLTRGCLSRVNRLLEQPFVVYVHPWEMDPDQPRIRHGGCLSRFRHYVNLSRTETRLALLLRNFRFGSVSEVVGCRAADGEEPATWHVCGPCESLASRWAYGR